MKPPLIQRVPTFDDPIAFLGACHRRLEARLASLPRAAAALADPAHPDRLEAMALVEAAVVHLREAGGRHQQDEEVSLFPRLTARAPALVVLCEALRDDHVLEVGLLASLESVASELRAAGPSPERAGCLAKIADQLQAHYGAHIRLEDSELLPEASRQLGAEDLAAIAKEMRLRRDP